MGIGLISRKSEQGSGYQPSPSMRATLLLLLAVGSTFLFGRHVEQENAAKESLGVRMVGHLADLSDCNFNLTVLASERPELMASVYEQRMVRAIQALHSMAESRVSAELAAQFGLFEELHEVKAYFADRPDGPVVRAMVDQVLLAFSA